MARFSDLTGAGLIVGMNSRGLDLTDRPALRIVWTAVAPCRAQRHGGHRCPGAFPFDAVSIRRSCIRVTCEGCTDVFVDMLLGTRNDGAPAARLVALVGTKQLWKASHRAWIDTQRRRNAAAGLPQQIERTVRGRISLATLTDDEQTLLIEILHHLASHDEPSGNGDALPVRKLTERVPTLFAGAVQSPSRVVDELIERIERLDPELGRRVETARSRKAVAVPFGLLPTIPWPENLRWHADEADEQCDDDSDTSLAPSHALTPRQDQMQMVRLRMRAGPRLGPGVRQSVVEAPERRST